MSNALDQITEEYATSQSGEGPGIRGTLPVIRELLASGSYRRLVITIGLVYLVAFLLAIENITPTTGSWSFTSVGLGAMFRRTGFLLFDSIALLRTPLFTVLIAPLNLAIGRKTELLLPHPSPKR